MGSKNIEVGANPVGLTNAITDFTNRQNILANAALNWEIIKGLKARTEFAIGHGWSEGKYYDDGSASSADNFNNLPVQSSICKDILAICQISDSISKTNRIGTHLNILRSHLELHWEWEIRWLVILV